MTTPNRAIKRDPDPIGFAREQRQRANDFSNDVWQMVRGRRILGAKFRREHPLRPYTLDFVCLDLKCNVRVGGKDRCSKGGATKMGQAFLIAHRRMATPGRFTLAALLYTLQPATSAHRLIRRLQHLTPGEWLMFTQAASIPAGRQGIFIPNVQLLPRPHYLRRSTASISDGRDRPSRTATTSTPVA
ncbi:MAG: DUF559 domain-containing protein [Planctomycetaceae bacterium]|nr:MAG: DUF559 domain-containing protein [Planctomycetaceae bacterium]